jgi:hypothetical protein
LHIRSISAVKRAEFVTHNAERSLVCYHVLAPVQDKINDIKDNFYEEVERVFDKFPKYHVKILFGDFNAKAGRKDICSQQLGVKVYTKLVMMMELVLVNFATSKNLTVRSIMFPIHNIHKFTLTFPDGKIQSDQPYSREKRQFQVYLTSDLSRGQIVILTTIYWWQKLRRDWEEI